MREVRGGEDMIATKVMHASQQIASVTCETSVAYLFLLQICYSLKSRLERIVENSLFRTIADQPRSEKKE